jgi:hypothetical protein
MKNLTFVIVYGGTDKCDLYITDYKQDDSQLLFSIMEKSVDSVIKSNNAYALTAVEYCRSNLKKTPYNFAKTFTDLPVSLSAEPFVDSANLTSVYLCDFTVDIHNKRFPALYRALDKTGVSCKSLISDIIHDLRNNPTGANGRKTDKLQNVKIYSISDESKELRKPAIGGLEFFRKAAESISLSGRNTVYVCEHVGDRKEIVYIAKYISNNKLQSFTLPTKIDYDVWRSNHFEVRVDDSEALRLSCEKVDVHCVESGCIIKAYFYLTKTTRAILDSALYKVGTTHNIEVILYSPDNSSKIKSGNSNAVLSDKKFTCEYGSNGDPLLIELTFVTKD